MDRTISDLIANYRKLVVSRIDNKARLTNLRTYLEFFERDLGGVRIKELTRAALNDSRERLILVVQQRTGRAATPTATTNRYFQTLHRMLSLARDVWGWEEADSAPRLPKLKESRPRTDFLSREQRIALLKACKESKTPTLYVVVVIAIGTGIRLGEIKRLTWSKIDLKRGVAILDFTKNGEPLRIKFGTYPLAVLQEYYRSHHTQGIDLVFPSPSDPTRPLCWRSAWRFAKNKAGLPSTFVFHSLRHSFASDLAAAGAQLLDIATLLNHKTITTTKRYAHLTREHTDKLVEAINLTQFEE